MALYLETQAETWGLATQRLPLSDESFNLLISYTTDTKAPRLLFESHIDTVGVEGMTIAPIAGDNKYDRIFGRGPCVIKGSGAAMLWALKKYTAQSENQNNIALLFTVDEEVGKSGILAFVERHLSELGWLPSAAICGEPTQLKLAVNRSAPLLNGLNRLISRIFKQKHRGPTYRIVLASVPRCVQVHGVSQSLFTRTFIGKSGQIHWLGVGLQMQRRYNVLSENVAAPKEKVSNRCGLRLY